MEKAINTNMTEQMMEIEEIAKKCLNLVKNNWYFKYRALSPAIYRMPTNFMPGTGIFGTDAYEVFVDPIGVILAFKEDSARFSRKFLHMLFHCIYLHPFLPEKNKDLWDVALDICAEAAVMRLNPPEIDGDSERADVIQKLSADGVKLFLPDPVSKTLQNGNYNPEELEELFHMDQHVWRHIVETPRISLESGNGDSGDSDDQDSQNGQGNQGGEGDQGDKDGQGSGSGDGDQDQGNQKNGGSGKDDEKRQEWSDVARQISTDLQSFNKQGGTGAGNMSMEIDYLTRDHMDYEDFLRGFSVMEEVMKIDLDEFDINTYATSLRRDDGILFIEPLEYKDDKVVKEFVIAIDTSGSCSGELVSKFLNKTYSILKSTESFSSRVNIHIVQCDAKVQSDTKIESLEELEYFLQNMKLCGFGGTDFRPVFEYVSELTNRGEFSNLGGLIYFTDGYGTFPQNPTPYKTAFVFMDDYTSKEVPSWAMSVYWNEDE